MNVEVVNETILVVATQENLLKNAVRNFQA